MFNRSNVTHSVLLLLNSTAPILIWMGSHSIQFTRNTDVVTQMAMMVEALYNSSRNIPFIKRQRAATAIDRLWFNRINWKQILPTWVKLKNTTSTSMTLSCDKNEIIEGWVRKHSIRKLSPCTLSVSYLVILISYSILLCFYC